MGATITENVIWTAENNEQRIVLRAKNNRYYPQRYIIGEHGPDWYFEPEFKGYKTLAGAKKSLKSCTLVARASFKTSNAVIYVIKGEEKSYHVTIINGKATGCCHADDNETCTGFSYRKTCGHVKLALAAEEKRIEEMCEAIALAPVLVGEIEVHVEDEFSGEQQTEEIIKQEYAILERERRASAPLQPSGHSVEETGFGFIPMRRAS